MGDELLAGLKTRGDLPRNEINESVSVRFVLELEVQAIMHFADVHTLLCSIMLDDELLKEEEGTLVVDPLPYLDLGDPQVRGVGFLAIIALLISNDELDHEALLN